MSGPRFDAAPRLNLLLVVAAAVYGVVGLGLVFAPGEVLAAIGVPPSAAGSWLAQALGAALLGFTWLNWLHRRVITQGILGRPVLLPNLTFVTVSFWLSLGAWRRGPTGFLLGCALVLGVLSVAFGARLFGRPSSADTPGGTDS